jgi:O-antigen ligase
MNILKQALVFAGLLSSALLLGLMAAVLPTGVVARLAVAMIAVMLLVVAWGFRREVAAFPERTLIRFSVFVLTTSVVWPQYVFFSAGGLPRVNPFTLSTVVGLISISVMLVYYKSFVSRIFSLLSEIKLVAILFVLWMGWRIVCNILSDAPIATNAELLREVIYVYSLFAFALFVCQGRNGIQLLGRIIVGCTLFVGLVGLIEAMEGKNRFIGFAASGEAGDVGAAIATIAAEKVRAGAFRVQSVFSHPILFGQYLGAAAPIVLMSFFLERSRMWKFFALIVLPLILLGILKSGSRSGFMALLISGAVLASMLWIQIVANSKRYRGFALVAVPLVLLVLLFAYGIGEQLVAGGSRVESGSTMVRTVQLNLAMSAIPRSPIFGFGLGAGVSIAGVKTYLNALTMDIFYLSILLDSGWVGLALFFSVVLSLTVASLHYVSRSFDQNRYYVSAYMASALSVIVTLGAVSMPQNIIFLLLAASILAVANMNRGRDELAT